MRATRRSAISGCITLRSARGRWSSLLHGFPEFWFGWRLQIQPLAAAGGMINYYRNAARQSPKHVEAQVRPISAPSLVIWGQDDRYLGQDLAEPDHDDVPGLDRVALPPGASHWVHHDEHERVNQLLIDFFAPALPAGNPAR